MGIIALYTDDENGGMSYVDNEDYGALMQTFTLPNAFTLNRFDVKLCRVGTPGTTILSFYKYPLEGSSYFSIIFNGNTLTDNIACEWKEFSFAERSFDAGTYALMLEAPYMPAGSRVWWAGKLGNEYTNGDGYERLEDGAEWVSAGGDFLFKLWGGMFSPPVGRPTTKRLIAAAASALWYEDV